MSQQLCNEVERQGKANNSTTQLFLFKEKKKSMHSKSPTSFSRLHMVFYIEFGRRGIDYINTNG